MRRLIALICGMVAIQDCCCMLCACIAVCFGNIVGTKKCQSGLRVQFMTKMWQVKKGADQAYLELFTVSRTRVNRMVLLHCKTNY